MVKLCEADRVICLREFNYVLLQLRTLYVILLSNYLQLFMQASTWYVEYHSNLWEQLFEICCIVGFVTYTYYQN